MGNVPRRRMKEFGLSEISSVDKPAQRGAVAVLIKRDGIEAVVADLAKNVNEFVDKVAELTGEDLSKSDDDDGDLADQIAKRYLDPAEGAMDFNTVLRSELDQKRFYAVCDQVYPLTYAMENSLKSIIADQNMDSAEKQTMMRNTVEEFLASVRAKWPDVEQALMKAFGEDQSEGDDMSKELEKQVADLAEKLDNATKALAAAEGGDDGQKAATELNKKVEELTATVGELTEKLEKAEAEKAAAEEAAKAEAEKAKLTAEEKAFMDEMDDEKEKMKFLQMSSADRKKSMKKSADDDETITIGKSVIRKSKVGEDVFDALKAQHEAAEEAKKRADQAETERQTERLAKRVSEEFDALKGETDAKVEALRAIDKIDDENVRDTIYDMLAAGNKAVKAAFDSLGHKGSGDLTKKGDEAIKSFEARVNDIAKRDSIPRTEAMAKARQEHPKEYEAYQAAQ